MFVEIDFAVPAGPAQTVDRLCMRGDESCCQQTEGQKKAPIVRAAQKGGKSIILTDRNQ